MRINFFLAGIILVALSSSCFGQGKEKIMNTPDVNELQEKKMSSNLNLGAELITMEQKVWEALKNKDLEGFGKNLAGDFLDFDADGTIYTRVSLLEYLKKVDLQDYTLEHFKAVVLNKDAVMILYKATVKGTINGQPAPGIPINCSSTWIKRDRQWLAVFHQETPIAPRHIKRRIGITTRHKSRREEGIALKR